MTRQEANLAILNILLEEIRNFPDGRFHQILHNLRLNEVSYQQDSLIAKDRYGEESVETLFKLKGQRKWAVKRTQPHYPCPCCGFKTMDEPPGSYHICEICGWEDDHVQLMNPASAMGANHESLWRAQRRIIRTLPVEDFKFFRGFMRDKAWRPLTREEHERAKADLCNVEYFNQACEIQPVYYWENNEI